MPRPHAAHLVAALAAALLLAATRGGHTVAPPPSYSPPTGFSAYGAGNSPGYGLQQPIDLNGDAVLDLVLVQGAAVVWIPGASFASPDVSDTTAPYALGTYQTMLNSEGAIDAFAVGDVSNDRWPDLVVARVGVIVTVVSRGASAEGVDSALFVNSAISVVLNNTAYGGSPVLLALTDMDRDGLSDIVFVSRSTSSVGTVWWMRNSGTGAWLTPLIVSANTYASMPYALLAVDVNLDTYADVIVAAGAGIYWHRSTGGVGAALFGATGAAQTTIVASGGAFYGPSLVTLDLNADGLVDLAASKSGMTFVWRTIATAPSVLTVVASCTHMTTSDYDLDGYDDLICVSAAGGTPRKYCANYIHSSSSGTLLEVATQQGCVLASTSNLVETGVAVADADNDGLVDVFLSDSFSVYLQRNGQSTVFTTNSASAAYVYATALPGSFQRLARSLGDIDGDGVADALWYAAQPPSGGNTVMTFQWMRGTGTGTFTTPINSLPTWTVSSGSFLDPSAYGSADINPIVVDFNLDGYADLLRSDGYYVNTKSSPYFSTTSTYFSNYINGMRGLPVYAGLLRYGTISGVTVAPDVALLRVNSGVSQLNIVYNFDFCGTPSSVYCYQPAYTSTTVTLPCGANPLPLVFADMNNDQRTDVVCVDPNYTLFWLANRGQGYPGGDFAAGIAVLQLNPFRPLALLRAVDVDGDGLMDLAAADQSLVTPETRATVDRQVVWLRNTGGPTGTFSLSSALLPVITCRLVLDFTATGPAETALIADMTWQDVDGDGLTDATVMCSSWCKNYVKACGTYNLYFVKNYGSGAFASPELISSAACYDHTLTNPGVISQGDLTKTGQPSTVFFSTCTPPSNSSATGNGALLAVINRSRKVTLTISATLGSAAAVTRGGSGQVVTVSNMQASQLALVLSQQCQLAAGTLVNVYFSSNALPVFTLALDYNLNPALRVCSIAFRGVSIISQLNWPCTRTPCLSAFTVPRGRLVLFQYVTFPAPGFDAQAITVARTSGRVAFFQCTIQGAVVADDIFALQFFGTLHQPSVNGSTGTAASPALISIINGGTLYLDSISTFPNTIGTGNGACLRISGTGSSATLIGGNIGGCRATTGKGGAVSVENGGQIGIFKTQFVNNRAYHGGAMYLAGAQGLFMSALSSGVFNGNTATVHGGAVFVESLATGSQPVIFTDVLFAYNVASTGLGSAIYYFDDTGIPTLNSPSYSNQQAPLGSRFKGVEITPTALVNATTATTLSVNVTLLDAFGRSAAASDGYVSLSGTCVIAVSSASYPVALSGNVATIAAGVCVFQGLVIRSQPGTNLTLTVSAAPYVDQPVTGSVSFAVSLAPCSPGSYYTSEECKACPTSSYSSTYNAALCQACNAGFVPNLNSAATDCVRCTSGYVSATGGLATCVKCDADKYTTDNIICRQCPAGQVPNAFQSGCDTCPAGYSAAPGDSRCTQCSPGSYTPGNSSVCSTCLAGSAPNAFQTGCTNCTDGTFAQPNMASCISCPSGQFTSDRKTCGNCPPGYVPDQLGASCVACQSGYIAAPGASQCTPCGTGEYASGGASCQQCAAGKAPNALKIGCNDCSDGTYAQPGTASCASCGTGQYTADRKVCQQCSAGEVPNVLGSGCVPCPDGSVALAGQTTCSQCSSGLYTADRVTCVTCPAGTVPNAFRSACTNCTDGTYAQPNMALCASCGSGQYTPDRKTCTACADGFVPNQLGSGCDACPPGAVATSGDTRCSQCSPGTYASSASTCSQCPGGSVPNGLQTGCNNCTEGTYATPGAQQCARCGSGQYTPDQQTCQSCLDGFVPNQLGSGCTPCPDGYVASSGAPVCIQCGLGTYTRDGVTCEQCPAGTVPNAFRSNCTTCLAGLIGVPGVAQCQACSSGLYTADGISCAACPAGQVPDQVGAACAACPAGSVAAPGDSRCQACAAGQITVGGDTCEQCPAGTVPSPDFSQCDPCEEGFIVAPNLARCQRCAANRFTNDSIACYSCDAGYVPVNNVCQRCEIGKVAQAGDGACTACIAGTFTVDNVSCGQCPDGSVPDGIGATCIPCGPGTTAVAGQFQCTPCSAGFYTSDAITCRRCNPGSQPSTNQTACVPCPVGTASSDGTFCATCTTGFSATVGASQCSACVSGLVCGTATGEPLAQPGFWVAFGAEGSDVVVTQCPFDWCSGGAIAAELGASSANRCKANHVNTSVLCGECDRANGYYMWDGDCRYCAPGTVAPIMILLYLAMFCYTMWLYYCAPGITQSGAVGTVIFVLQTLGVLVSVYTTGTSSEGSSISWLNGINLEVSFNQCPGTLLELNPDLPPFYVWFWLKMAQPVVMLGMVGFLVLLSLLLRLCGDGKTDLLQRIVSALPERVQGWSIFEAIVDESPMQYRAAKAALNVMLFCYLPVLKVVFTVFNLIALPGSAPDVRVVAADPSIYSNDPLYRAHLAIAAVICALYLPLPFALYYIALRHRRADYINSKGAQADGTSTDAAGGRDVFALTWFPPQSARRASTTTASSTDATAAAPGTTAAATAAQEVGKAGNFKACPSDSDRTVAIFGVILQPYVATLPWMWVLLELRKVGVLVLVVFLGSFRVDLQNTLLAVLFCALLLTLDVFRPFRKDFSHIAESAGLAMLIIAVQSREPTVTGYYFIWAAVAAYALFIVTHVLARYCLERRATREAEVLASLSQAEKPEQDADALELADRTRSI